MARITKNKIDEFPFPYDKKIKKGKNKGDPVNQAFLWDSETRGFAARFTRDGKCTYFVQGRVKGKELRLTIGPHGVFTVEQARDAAKEHLRSMRLGIDPRNSKLEDEAAKITLRAVADEYMSRPGKLKDSSKEQIERHVTTTFKAYLDKPVASITETFVRKRYREMLTGGLHGDREGGSPGQANQGFAILRALINYAIRNHKKADGSRIFTVNPTEALKDHWITLEERDTYVQPAKIGAVWNYLYDLRDTTYVTPTLSGIDLTIFQFLTGSRLGEPQKLTWDRVNISDDEKDCWWHLPDPKNRRPIWLPLSKQAVTLLKERPRIEGNPYVFPGKIPKQHVSNTALL